MLHDDILLSCRNFISVAFFEPETGEVCAKLKEGSKEAYCKIVHPASQQKKQIQNSLGVAVLLLAPCRRMLLILQRHERKN